MTRAAPASPRSSVETWLTWAIFLLALAPRLYVALAWAREPVWDGHYYHFGAVRIAEGFGYSEDIVRNGIHYWKPWTHYPVGYSAWLGGLYYLFGSHSWVAPVANALLGSAAAALVFRLGLGLLGRWRSLLAGLLVALHPGLIVYSAVVMTEPLAGMLLITALALLLTLRRRPWLAFAVSGMVLGLAVLVRPSNLLAVPLLALAAPDLRRRAWLGLAARTTLALICCVAVVLPWTYRNCKRTDGCAFVSTNTGWNLAIGALTDTGRFRTLRAADGCPVVTGQVQQDRCWFDVGMAEIRRAPGRWLALAPKKLAQTFDHESFAIEYLHEAEPERWPESRRAAARELLTQFHRGLMGLAALAVVSWPSRRHYGKLSTWFEWALLAGLAALIYATASSDEHPYHRVLIAMLVVAMIPRPGRPWFGPALRFSLAFIAATLATHVAFFGDDRYHLIVTPLLCLLAAAALRGPASEDPQRLRG